MLDFMKRKHRPADPPPMTHEQGQKAAVQLHEIIMGAGCLVANVAGLGQELAIAVTEGTISEADLDEAINRVHNAHDDLERACKRVSQVRKSLAPPVAAVQAQKG
jgi:hypothetical protein